MPNHVNQRVRNMESEILKGMVLSSSFCCLKVRPPHHRAPNWLRWFTDAASGVSANERLFATPTPEIGTRIWSLILDYRVLVLGARSSPKPCLCDPAVGVQFSSQGQEIPQLLQGNAGLNVQCLAVRIATSKISLEALLVVDPDQVVVPECQPPV